MMFFILACGGGGLDFPSPDSSPPLRGAGGPSVDFSANDLWNNCAFLDGGETDADRHNIVTPYRGHLLLPWAPEWGGGGLSLFDVDDPCNPVLVGEGSSEEIRETHSLGAVYLPDGDEFAGDYVVVSGVEGPLFWDITDPENPVVASTVQLPDIFYPDGYARVVLSVFWQYPWVYVAAADNGLFVVNARDPYNPELVGHQTFDPILRLGAIVAMGNLAMASTAEGPQTVLLDISNPTQPQAIAGGLFYNSTAENQFAEAYSGNLVGDWALYALREGGGGPIVWDVSDPSQPEFVSNEVTDGNGGYIYYDEGHIFVGDSSAARVYDASDMTNLSLIGEGFLDGDLDTVVPYGNIAVLSCDSEVHNEGQASAVMPWSLSVDSVGPEVLRVVPEMGEVGVALSARIGVGFNEFIEPSSVFTGSIKLTDESGHGVAGWGSAQETIASFTPHEPLLPNTTYLLEVAANGVMDANGNRTEGAYISTFTTGSR